ncbi:hypothetical protein PCASD_15782 [Puccinia coronata f. sp. avenae]|uniref:alpha-galactosidase n=1 Tax=Puccinia coronata f. sp. avenae TaxID=200324 RepID=A0A2N5TWX4_9BASI|nr:hypothetical protein PCASD_15782 [Puccinia coronata f. sp. avenae]
MRRIFQQALLATLSAFVINHPAPGSAQAPGTQPPSIANLPTVEPLSNNSDTDFYFGWSTWSLQAYKGKGYGYSWVTETNIKRTADILSREFSALGYTRINLDSGWQDIQLDEYGRTVLNHTSFPSGIKHLSNYLAQRKLKLGLYYLPGIDSRAVNNKSAVMNTKYTADQIVQCPDKEALGCNRTTVNAFNAGMALNYSHPGAQMYINSLVDGLYSWGVSFVKLDGIVPGSSMDPPEFWKYDTSSDLRAWRKGIDELYEQKWRKQGRERIWLGASWKLPTYAGATMEKYMNSFRVEQDIEAYSETEMTTFDRVIRNAKTAALWSSVDTNRRWKGIRDLDSILISDMTLSECRSMVTIWAMFGSLFYLGDDLTKLPASRRALVKNPEVLKLARLASTNQARLDGFDTKNSTAQSSNMRLLSQKALDSNQLQPQDAKRIQQESVKVCRELGEKRRIVFECSLHQELDDPEYHYKTCVKSQTNQQKLQLLSASDAESDQPDQWTLQTWVLEQGQGDIYVAVVNAGKQDGKDKPAEVQISLRKLKTLQQSPRIDEMRGMHYKPNAASTQY